MQIHKKTRIKRGTILIIILLLVLNTALAQTIKKEEIKLLAIADNGTKKIGAQAVLELEITPGNERVYLETYPLTKITTQASLRFAQQIACKKLEKDCTNYNFLWSLKALPGLVGGPSAGAAAALLVSSLLLNKEIPKDLAITGTINSGGIIGPVGGIKEKIKAASQNGIKKVIIPKGTKSTDEQNKTINITNYAKKLNLTLYEVNTLDEVLRIALKQTEKENNQTLKINPRYKTIMKSIANDLCNRTKNFAGKTETIKNLTKKAKKALEKKEYYSAASYCFRANTASKQELYNKTKYSKEEKQEKLAQLEKDIENFTKTLKNKTKTTITDLQTYMAVKERTTEAQELIKEINKTNITKEDMQNIGYAEERLFSAKTWAKFFDGQDEKLQLDTEHLKKSCISKISEAEERFNYVSDIIKNNLAGIKEEIDRAKKYMLNKQYIMCFYDASKAKAETNVLLSLLGASNEYVKELTNLKIKVAKEEIIKSLQKNIFPIIGYSYYEYAKTLSEFDEAAALVFAEYSLELSNTDIYFKKEKTKKTEIKISQDLITGIVLGIIAGLIISRLSKEKKKKKKKKKDTQ